MSDYDRGAYAPPSDAPLAFDARDHRERRPAPVSLIVGILVLLVLGGALLLLYRGGVRERGDAPPPVVGEPVGSVRTAPEAAAPVADPTLQLDVYEDRDPRVEAIGAEPSFAPDPEDPVARPVAPPAMSVAPVPPAPPAPQVPPAPAPTIAAPAPAAAPRASAPRPDVAAARPSPSSPPAARPASARPAATIDSVLASAPAAAAANVAPQARPAAGGGPVAVQIGAFSSHDLAQSQLASARGRTPGGSGVRVEPAPNGLHRGLVTGFASRADAQAYCGRLRAAGGDCLVR